MIIEIIPAIRLPRNLNHFSYTVSCEIESKIKVGQIVQINFHGRNCQGLITKINKIKKSSSKKSSMGRQKTNKKIKNINKILFELPLLTQLQIKLIQYIAKYYAVSEGTVCRSMLPEIPAKNKKIKKLKNLNTGSLKHWRTGTHLIWWKDIGERNKKYLEILKQNADKQVLILVPQIEMTDKIIKDLGLDEDKIIKITSQATKSKTKFFNIWLEILSGEPKIIIGTKISVLLPFNNLGTVIVENENDWNHKQSDINPRYDARNVCAFITKYLNCPLYLATQAPSVESYYHLVGCKFHNLHPDNDSDMSSWPQVKIPAANRKNNKQTISIIDLQSENLKGNYSFLSDELIWKIKTVLDKKQKIFLLHNRKGLVNLIACQDCGYVFKCPDCQISLVYYDKTKKIHCHHCNFSKDIPPLCPKCNGPRIKFKGKGLEDIAIKLKKIFQDNKTETFYKSTDKAFNKNYNGFEIMIGTEFALNKIDFKNIGLVSIINFGQFTGHPDFRTNEKAYHILCLILSNFNHTEFVIQTYNPENIILKSVEKKEPEIFYEEELKQRKELSYPPFVKLVKIISQDKSNARAYYLADKLAVALKKTFKEINVLGPIAAYPRLAREKYRYHIILKTKQNLKNSILQNIFKQIPDNFIIDVGPEKLA